MRKTALYITTALLLASSCNESLIEPHQKGAISLSLSSDREVDVTKASAVDCSNFNVNIFGETFLGASFSETYIYSEMGDQVEIPFGYYKVSAENCSESAAETGFGTVRYYGVSNQVDVLSTETEPVAITCKMVNGKVTLTLDDSYLADFKNPYAELTVGGRTLTLTGSQANIDNPVYFNVPAEGAELIYKVYGTVGQGTSQQKLLMYTNSANPLKLEPAKWAKITIKSNHNGQLGPDIFVDGTLYDTSFVEVLDPDGGIEVEYSNMPVTLKIDTSIENATVVDCILDVLN